MPVSSETVSLAGSGLVFNNTYAASVTDPVRAAVIQAENYLQAHFTDTATINVTFNFDHLGAAASARNLFSVFIVPYPLLVFSLAAHASTADDRVAVAGLPLVDPTHGVGIEVSVGQAQVLGLANPTGETDVTLTVNADEPWTFGSDLVGAIEHELSEGALGRFELLGLTALGGYSILDLFRFNAAGQHDYTGGRDGQFTVFGLDANHLTNAFLHNSVRPDGTTDGSDLGDWDFTFEDAFGTGGGGIPASISAVDLQVLDVIGWTPSGAPPGSGPDDFADSFGDASHPFGQLQVGAPFAGTLQAIGDRDWFKVTLTAGVDYVINLSGQGGGGGTLDDSVLTLRDASGRQIASNDDVGFGNFDSRLIFHATTTGTYFVEAGSFADFTTGTYTLTVQAGAAAGGPGADVLVGTTAGGSILAGAGNDTITADNVQNYLRGEDGDDVIYGGTGFDDINGNMGNDTAHGGAGDDWVVGGKDSDMLFGDSGVDIVWGNLGNDTLDGGSGDDQVRGGQGNDVVNGGSGNDFVSGDRGDDTITGGTGADIFHGSQDAGLDKVMDFSLAQGDKVMLDPGTTFTVSQVGADTVIDMGGANRMILVGVQMSTLPPGTIFLG